jgi:arsenite transporter
VNRDAIDRVQVPVFAAAVVAGAGVGGVLPGVAGPAEAAVWPALALLLFATFLQVRVSALPRALRERRFLGASLAGNFALVPLVVFGLLWLVPDDPGIRVGVVLVLLAPCTDWFTSFTHAGRGDTRLAIAMTPLLLVAQLALLPLYLWLLAGQELDALPVGRALTAFTVVVALPLALAWLAQSTAHPQVERWTQRAGAGVTPLIALTLFLVAASQVRTVFDAGADVGRVSLVFVAYLMLAAVLAKALARRARLGSALGRTLAFNLGTRNSFVVLPIALAMPEAYALAVPVIAAQTLVELAGMVAYVRLVPSWLFRDDRTTRTQVF